jgi:hypothetical protein
VQTEASEPWTREARLGAWRFAKYAMRKLLQASNREIQRAEGLVVVMVVDG